MRSIIVNTVSTCLCRERRLHITTGKECLYLQLLLSPFDSPYRPRSILCMEKTVTYYLIPWCRKHIQFIKSQIRKLLPVPGP
jgi:hypothetical protein